MFRIDWIQFYQLSDDPFSVNPIIDKSQRPLFHLTGDIEKQVLPFLNVANGSDPRIRLIVSDRGMGKTSLLRFIQWRLEEDGIVGFYVKAFETLEASKTHVDLARGVLRDLVASILEFIVERKPAVYEKYKLAIDHNLELLGKSVLGGKIFSTSVAGIQLAEMSHPLKDVVRILHLEKIPFAVYIDNLDKYDATDTVRIVYEMLRMPVSQSAFETILEARGFVFLPLATPLYETMLRDGKGDFSYLDDPFRLQPLRPPEALSLMETRFRARSKANFPLTPDGVVEIVANSAGNIRGILQRGRRAFEYGAERALQQLGTEDVLRALREAKDFPTFFQEFSNEPGMRAGLRFAGELLTKGHEGRRVQALTKAAYRSKKKRKLSPGDRQVLEEFSLGGQPIKGTTAGFEINDQRLADFLTFVEENRLEVEGFLDWFLEGRSVPEFAFSTSFPELRLGASILEALRKEGASAFRTIHVKTRRPLDCDRSHVLHEIESNLSAGLSTVNRWKDGGLEDRTNREVVGELTSSVVVFYRAFAYYLAGRQGSTIDLLPGVIEGFSNIIFGLENHLRATLTCKSDVVELVRLHRRYARENEDPSPEVMHETQRLTNNVILEILRCWKELLAGSKVQIEKKITGVGTVAKAIDDALSLSDCHLGRVTIPGQTPRDFALYFWPGRNSYWAFVVHGAQNKDLAQKLSRQTANVGNVRGKLRLPRVFLDTNALVSGLVSKHFEFGLFERSDVTVPAPIRFEYEFNEAKTLRAACLREISKLEANEGTHIQRLVVEDASQSPFEVARDGLPGNNRALGTRIDEALVRSADERAAIIVSGDPDLLGHLRPTSRAILMANDAKQSVYPIESIGTLLDTLAGCVNHVEVSTYATRRALEATFKLQVDGNQWKAKRLAFV